MILDSDSGSQGVKGSAFRVPEGQGVGLVGPNGLKGDVRGVGVGDIIEKIIDSRYIDIFIGPRSDHSLLMSLTN